MATPEDALSGTTFDQLLSEDESRLLDVIDQLRTQGVGRLLGEDGLPQLIVCGDQSSGKSSVLEGLTRVRFPSRSSVCTTFACELRLRRGHTSQISSRIKPADSRSEQDKIRLSQFHGSFTFSDRFPELINAARECMAGNAGTNPTAFFEDILQVTIVGPDLAPLTIVDLPGLFHYRNSGDRDVNLVTSLVQRYMKQNNSIVLAVVSASNDINNQVILNHTKRIVPNGSRTLGIITKPDLLPSGSEQEQEYLDLAKTNQTNFEHGWHVVRNRTYAEQAVTNEERDAAEEEFFSGSSWAGASSRQVGLGIDALRTKLSKMLLNHICLRLPAITERLGKDLEESDLELKRLGEPRENAEDQQVYLSNISDQFYEYTSQALEGRYRRTSFFGDASSPEGMEKRLRATVRNLNDKFANEILQKGHKWHINEDAAAMGQGNSGTQAGHPQVISRSQFLKNIVDPLARSERANELPGISNPLLIGSLFQQQSEPWEQIAIEHLKSVWNAIKGFFELLLSHITEERTSNQLDAHIIGPAMDYRLQAVLDKLQELLAPHRDADPINIDPGFAHKIRLLQEKRIAKPVAEAVQRDMRARGLFSTPPVEEVLARISLGDTPENDRYGSLGTLDSMQAYYDTTILNFINNVATLAVEQCLLKGLPKIFSPVMIRSINNENLKLIAAESRETVQERERLKKKKDVLERGLKTLRGINPGGLRRTRNSRHSEVIDTNVNIADSRNTTTSNSTSHLPNGTVTNSSVSPRPAASAPSVPAAIITPSPEPPRAAPSPANATLSASPGNTSSASTPRSNIFSQPASTSNTGFGQPVSGGLFGNPTQPRTSPSTGFGQNISGGGGFGSVTSTATATPSAFGSPFGSRSQDRVSPFGRPLAVASGAGSSKSTGFGDPRPVTSPFSSTPTPATTQGASNPSATPSTTTTGTPSFGKTARSTSSSGTQGT